MSNQLYQQTFPFVISNSFASEQILPDIDLKNPLDAPNFVNAIEIIPDPAFQQKGMIEVYVNMVRVFASPKVGFFKAYQRFSIPISARALDNQGHVLIFAWNGLADSSPITATCTIKISSQNVDLSSGSIPSGSPLGSDTKIIFPYLLRAIGTYTQQLDLSGYTKLLLLIASAAYVVPVSIVSGGQGTDSTPNNMIDGNLGTHGIMNTNVLGGSFYEIVDFGNIANRIAAVNTGNSTGGTFTTKTEVSSDGVNYINGTGALQSFRYIRFTLINTSGTQNTSLNVNEIYDSNVFGGTASISFEGYEPSSQQWITIISAAQIGSISTGQAVSVQLGDTMVTANLNAILTSNYAGLRMKLTITIASIQTAISVQRLA